MTTSAMIHVRVNEEIKVQATETLASMGLTVSDAVRVFLMRVVADRLSEVDLKRAADASEARLYIGCAPASAAQNSLSPATPPAPAPPRAAPVRLGAGWPLLVGRAWWLL